MFSIGLDFGSLFTKITIIHDGIISYLNCGKGDYSRSDIPSSIKYTQDDHKEPELVIDISTNDWYELFDPLDQSYFSEIRSLITKSEHGQPDVVKDFFDLLMKQLQDKYHTFQPSQAKLGLALPDEWYEDPDHPAAERLFAIFENFGFQKELIQFQRESTCAAASFVHDMMENGNDLPSQPFHVLICDIGGSKTRFRLCEISQNKIYINKKNDNPTISGKAFDEALLHQLTQEQGIEIPLESIKKSYLALIEIGKRDIDDLLSQPLTQPIMKIISAISNPRIKDTLIYKVPPKSLSIKQVWDAFSRIHENLTKMLSTITQEYQIDHVLLTGGFSQYPLITTTINEYFNSEAIINHKNPIHAISRGAALLTGEKVTLREPIEYSVTMTLNTIRNGKIIHIPKELISPDNAGLNIEAVFDPPVTVTIKDNQGPLIMVKKQADQETILCIDKEYEHSQWPPPPGEYTLAMKINRHGELFLLLKSINSEAFYEHKLSEQESMSHDQ